MSVKIQSTFTVLSCFWSKWLTWVERRETGETGETRHNNSPPTKKLRLRLGWGRGGVWVEVGLGWGSAINYYHEKKQIK